MAVARRTRIAYALPAFALAVAGIPIDLYVPNESRGPEISVDDDGDDKTVAPERGRPARAGPARPGVNT